jgi:uncharacterized protein
VIESGGADISDDASWIKIGDGALTIEIVARPGSSRTGFHRIAPRGLVIGINAAPEKGKANAELTAFLAKTLEIPRGAVTILRGESSRRKMIRIESKSPSEIAARLQSIVTSAS